MIGMGIPTSQSKTERMKQTSKLTFGFNNLLAFVWFRGRYEVNLQRPSVIGQLDRFQGDLAPSPVSWDGRLKRIVDRHHADHQAVLVNHRQAQQVEVGHLGYNCDDVVLR